MSIENVKQAITILELEYNPTNQYSICDIKKQYKKLALKYHPDKSNIHNTGKFQSICLAKDYLLNNPNSNSTSSKKNETDVDYLLSEIDTLCIMYNVIYKGIFTYMVKKKVSDKAELSNFLTNVVLDNMVRLIEKKIKYLYEN